MKITYMNAMRDAIAEEMRINPNIIYLGEGIAERGGCYGQSKNLWQEFGRLRVIDTPISENGFTAFAIGAAVGGLFSIVDIMFGDILFEIMSPLCQQAAKLSYMSRGSLSVPMLVRVQIGAKTMGPHHSGSLYPICMHIPGLNVIIPSNPYDAKGLMKTALKSKDPVIMFENKFLYSMRSDIPDEEYSIPFGQANIVQNGHDVTVVAISSMVSRVAEAVQTGRISGSVEIIDPRTLVPLDSQTIINSVRKTGRLVIVEESHLTCGAGAEIIARVCEEAMSSMKSPFARIAAADVPNPYAPVLENAILPTMEKIINAINHVLEVK